MRQRVGVQFFGELFLTRYGTLFCRLNDFPFAEQHLAQRYLAWPRIVPDIVTPLSEFLQFGNGKALTTRAAQCLPYLAFQHDRVAVEQMFLCPLHRFTNIDSVVRHRVMLRLF